MTKKLGLDFHGVIDKYPKFFSFLTEELIKRKWQVHIITGRMWTSKFEKKLKKLKIHWTHCFSITDSLIKKHEKVTWLDSDNPVFDKDKWNRAKGQYCKEKKITIHFDDSDIYGKYFETPYMNIAAKKFYELENLVTVEDGVPCIHPGCLQHISHPCEVCHRIGGKGIAVYGAELEREKRKKRNFRVLRSLYEIITAKK